MFGGAKRRACGAFDDVVVNFHIAYMLSAISEVGFAPPAHKDASNNHNAVFDCEVQYRTEPLEPDGPITSLIYRKRFGPRSRNPNCSEEF